MRSQTEFHERSCVRQSGRREAVVLLIALHGCTGLEVPLPVRLLVQVACLGKRALNLLDAVRFKVNLRYAPLVVA